MVLGIDRGVRHASRRTTRSSSPRTCWHRAECIRDHAPRRGHDLPHRRRPPGPVGRLQPDPGLRGRGEGDGRPGREHGEVAAGHTRTSGSRCPRGILAAIARAWPSGLLNGLLVTRLRVELVHRDPRDLGHRLRDRARSSRARRTCPSSPTSSRTNSAAPSRPGSSPTPDPRPGDRRHAGGWSCARRASGCARSRSGRRRTRRSGPASTSNRHTVRLFVMMGVLVGIAAIVDICPQRQHERRRSPDRQPAGDRRGGPRRDQPVRRHRLDRRHAPRDLIPVMLANGLVIWQCPAVLPVHPGRGHPDPRRVLRPAPSRASELRAGPNGAESSNGSCAIRS